jgi:hypothetical protein
MPGCGTNVIVARWRLGRRYEETASRLGARRLWSSDRRPRSGLAASSAGRVHRGTIHKMRRASGVGESFLDLRDHRFVPPSGMETTTQKMRATGCGRDGEVDPVASRRPLRRRSPWIARHPSATSITTALRPLGGAASPSNPSGDVSFTCVCGSSQTRSSCVATSWMVCSGVRWRSGGRCRRCARNLPVGSVGLKRRLQFHCLNSSLGPPAPVLIKTKPLDDAGKNTRTGHHGPSAVDD